LGEFGVKIYPTTPEYRRERPIDRKTRENVLNI
jgi:hypothetical protein